MGYAICVVKRLGMPVWGQLAWRTFILHYNPTSCTINASVFEAMDSPEEGYAPRLQRAFHAVSDRDVQPSDTTDQAVAQEAPDRSDAENKALHYILSAFFSTLHALVENSHQYTLKDEDLHGWLEVAETLSWKHECFR